MPKKKLKLSELSVISFKTEGFTERGGASAPIRCQSVLKVCTIMTWTFAGPEHNCTEQTQLLGCTTDHTETTLP